MNHLILLVYGTKIIMKKNIFCVILLSIGTCCLGQPAGFYSMNKFSFGLSAASTSFFLSSCQVQGHQLVLLPGVKARVKLGKSFRSLGHKRVFAYAETGLSYANNNCGNGQNFTIPFLLIGKMNSVLKSYSFHQNASTLVMKIGRVAGFQKEKISNNGGNKAGSFRVGAICNNQFGSYFAMGIGVEKNYTMSMHANKTFNFQFGAMLSGAVSVDPGKILHNALKSNYFSVEIYSLVSTVKKIKRDCGCLLN
jgi:hypothetical protein